VMRPDEWLVVQNAKHNPELFPVYLTRFEEISELKEKYDSRIRFLILDTLELANNQWQTQARSNTQGGYNDRHGHSGHGHGSPPQPPLMDVHESPRHLNASLLPPGILHPAQASLHQGKGLLPRSCWRLSRG
jgi:hypothetical protein